MDFSVHQLMSDDDVTVSFSSGQDAPPFPPSGGSDRDPVFPTLAGVTDLIATNIPSLAGFATSIGGSAPTAPALTAPSAPPSIDSMANSIATHIPSLAGAASTVANPATASLNSTSTNTPVPANNTGAVSLDSIVSSFANIPGLAGLVSSVANPAVSPMTTPATLSAPPPSLQKFGDAHTGTSISQSISQPINQSNVSIKLRLCIQMSGRCHSWWCQLWTRILEWHYLH